MGWDVRNDGLAVVFSRDIPTLVRTEMRTVATDYLARHGLCAKDIDDFVCHPGGAKVVSALEDVFELPAGEMRAARKVLRRYGNMSAATILFVLKEALSAASAKRRLLSALGPGFTAGFVTLEDRAH
jgi:alkylresorcinol/alkylpyrone synthase